MLCCATYVYGYTICLVLSSRSVRKKLYITLPDMTLRKKEVQYPSSGDPSFVVVAPCQGILRHA
jgi:hypothetical protein